MILSRTSEVTMFEQCTGKLVPHGRSGRQMSDYEGLTDEKEAYSTDSREDANSTIFRNWVNIYYFIKLLTFFMNRTPNAWQPAE